MIYYPPVESIASVSAEKYVRLLSIDALRGFDMLFIAGGGTFLNLMEGKTGWTWVDFLSRQMHHATWDAHITFFDLIFPIFLFLAGASLPFSLNKALAQGKKKGDLYRKAFWRMLIFIGIIIVYKNSGYLFFEPSNIRYLGILGRIGIAGFFYIHTVFKFSPVQPGSMDCCYPIIALRGSFSYSRSWLWRR